MTNKELALEIVLRNEETIKDRLFGDGYMFDDEFDVSMSSPVARELTNCFKEHFRFEYFELEDEQYVIREETNKLERSEGVLYFSECEESFAEICKIAKRHYKSK